MRIVIFFINIGFYHKARLRAALQACKTRGWDLYAVQLIDDSLEHPWGKTEDNFEMPVLTLLSEDEIKRKNSNPSHLPIAQQAKVDLLMKSLKPDVVFLPGWSFDLSKKVLKYAHKNNISSVVMSESKYDDEPRSWWKELLKSLLYLRKFDGALVGGDKHAAYAAKLGIPSNAIFKGYDVVDNAHFFDASAHTRSNLDHVRMNHPKIPSRPYFMAAFRLLPRKNAINLIEAYKIYSSEMRGDAWDLVICGNGEQHHELVNLIDICGLEKHVHLVGFLAYQEVGQWYGLAEAFIHPALKEQWGLVINEACAAGLPILCSKTVGAAPDLVHENANGFLFDPKNPSEIASCMIRLHRLDDEERWEMGRQSQLLAKKLDPSIFGESVVKTAIAAIERRKIRQ